MALKASPLGEETGTFMPISTRPRMRHMRVFLLSKHLPMAQGLCPPGNPLPLTAPIFAPRLRWASLHMHVMCWALCEEGTEGPM